MTTRWLRRVPKVELHVHLDGSLRLKTFLELAKQLPPDRRFPDSVDLRKSVTPRSRGSLEEYLQCFEYTIGVPVDGHTFRPAVRIEGSEAPNVTDYPSDEVTYPDSLGLYEPGFEFIDNVTPPSGGTAYSAQKLLAQKIWEEDINAKGGLLGRPVKLVYYDDQTKARYLPHVIEPSAGADRAALAFLCEAYTEDEVPDEKGKVQD